MASKIVFFILTVIKVNIISSANLSSNVHEMMTPEEIYQTFGTDDGSVPYYQVVLVALPKMTRTHQANDEIHLKVEINDTEISLTFKPTAGFLATRYTPVWSAVTDQKAYNKIRYDPLPNAMENIGEFKMYQDVDNNAAIVIYEDPDHETIIEGIVTLEYAIKSLPKRLMNQTLKVGDNYFVESPLHHEKLVFISTRSAKNVRRHEEQRQYHSRTSERERPEAVYPEILLVLDHNAIRNHTITQALRFVLAFWNGADMIYSTLNDPKVYLNIAGIIISADDAATPYIAQNTSVNIKTYSHDILDELPRYFATELDRFPLLQYDMIFAMTPTTLCNEGTDLCFILLGAASFTSACTSEQEVKQRNEINGIGFVYYNWMFGGVRTAVHESAHLFGVRHDEGTGATAQCNYTEGYAMAATAKFRHQSSKWSPCSEIYFRHYFSSIKSKCLDNKPMWIKPVKKVLPGRWLTLDGQCQNSGFEKSCQIPDNPVCAINGCQSRKSNECKISEDVTLAGTKCGENKHVLYAVFFGHYTLGETYCETGTGCVDE